MRRFVAVLSTLACAAGVAGCGTSAATPTADTVAAATVTAVHPTRGDVVRRIALPGDLTGWNETALHAKVTGYLKSIAVDKGDPVEKGRTLAEVEVPELAQKLARARANLHVQQRTYDRLRGVWQVDHRLVAQEDVDIAEGRFEQAKAEVDELAALVDYTHIVAPFSGVVTARYVDPGALIRAGGGNDSGGAGGGSDAPLLRLADISRLRVYVYVPEDATSAVHVGQPASLQLREFPGRTFTGVLARFAPALDLSTRTMLTEVDIENPGRELYPGMYAQVTLELQRNHDVLRIPSDAVSHADGSAYVWTVTSDTLTKTPVTLGLNADGWCEIQHGLNGAALVVRPVTPGLSAGQHVRAVAADTTSTVARAD